MTTLGIIAGIVGFAVLLNHLMERIERAIGASQKETEQHLVKIEKELSEMEDMLIERATR